MIITVLPSSRSPAGLDGKINWLGSRLAQNSAPSLHQAWMAHTNSDLESLPPQVRVPKAQNRYQAGRPSPNPRPPNILQAHDLLSASLQMPSAAWQEWNSEKDAYKPVLFFLPSL